MILGGPHLSFWPYPKIWRGKTERKESGNRIAERSIRLCRDLAVQKADRRRSLVSVSCRNDQSERFWVLVCFAVDSLQRSDPTFGCFRIASVLARLADRNRRRELGLVDRRRRRPTNRSQGMQRFSAWLVAADCHRKRRSTVVAGEERIVSPPLSPSLIVRVHRNPGYRTCATG